MNGWWYELEFNDSMEEYFMYGNIERKEKSNKNVKTSILISISFSEKTKLSLLSQFHNKASKPATSCFNRIISLHHYSVNK